MAEVYFPGCKYTAHAPDNSAALGIYFMKKGASVAGCCSTDHAKLTAEDTAIYSCNTCHAILQESAPQAKLRSVWEVLARDDRFLWPDYGGKSVILQDCWRIRENRPMQDALRTVLQRMNCKVIELGENYAQANFCGTTLLKPPSPRYETLAPVRFLQNAGDKFQPHTQEEQVAQMQEYCRRFGSDTVVCYCTGCLEGLRIGGANVIHCMDMVLGAL